MNLLYHPGTNFHTKFSPFVSRSSTSSLLCVDILQEIEIPLLQVFAVVQWAVRSLLFDRRLRHRVIYFFKQLNWIDLYVWEKKSKQTSFNIIKSSFHTMYDITSQQSLSFSSFANLFLSQWYPVELILIRMRKNMFLIKELPWKIKQSDISIFWWNKYKRMFVPLCVFYKIKKY